VPRAVRRGERERMEMEGVGRRRNMMESKHVTYFEGGRHMREMRGRPTEKTESSHLCPFLKSVWDFLGAIKLLQ